MDAPSGRLADLERRAGDDPPPFVYAQLAEEYCRLGRFEDAAACCRAGLSRHPGYLAVRLILARTLAALSRWNEAAIEYQAITARLSVDETPRPVPLVDFDELLARLGMPGQSPPPLVEMLLTDPHRLARLPSAVASSDVPPSTLDHETRAFSDRPGAAPPGSTAVSLNQTERADEDRTAQVLAELEAWLGALRSERASRAGS